MKRDNTAIELPPGEGWFGCKDGRSTVTVVEHLGVTCYEWRINGYHFPVCPINGHPYDVRMLEEMSLTKRIPVDYVRLQMLGAGAL